VLRVCRYRRHRRNSRWGGFAYKDEKFSGTETLLACGWTRSSLANDTEIVLNQVNELFSLRGIAAIIQTRSIPATGSYYLERGVGRYLRVEQSGTGRVSGSASASTGTQHILHKDPNNT
jgi:hypothetical protein